MDTNRAYTVIELFAGAGGLALGLEQAGFTTEATVEIDKWACQTLKKNRPEWNVIKGDIQKISQEGIKRYLQNTREIDLLSEGYPCQSFSYAGNRQGMDDVLEEIQQNGIKNTVFDELKGIDDNMLKSLYLLSFQKYEGFDSLDMNI